MQKCVNGALVDLTPEEVAAWEAEQALPPPIPQAVTPLQGMLALDQVGAAVGFEAWATHPDRTFAERAFIQRASTWRRDDPVLAAGAAALGLDSGDLDSLFMLAATL